MARKPRKPRSATANDIAEIERLLHELEERLEHLGTSAMSGAGETGHALSEMISGALSALTDRLRTAVHDGAQNVGEEAARVGSDAWRKIEEEVEYRPLATLAVAAGIGFLIGVLAHRH